jgi:hypothetical protein
VASQRGTLGQDAWNEASWVPPPSPKYQLTAQGNRLLVQCSAGRSDFTPRFLYVNRKDRRIFVDFGHYAVKQDEVTRRWGVLRLSLAGNDYFSKFSLNVALQPYFYFRDGVMEFVPVKAGQG